MDEKILKLLVIEVWSSHYSKAVGSNLMTLSASVTTYKKNIITTSLGSIHNDSKSGIEQRKRSKLRIEQKTLKAFRQSSGVVYSLLKDCVFESIDLYCLLKDIINTTPLPCLVNLKCQ